MRYELMCEMENYFWEKAKQTNDWMEYDAVVVLLRQEAVE